MRQITTKLTVDCWDLCVSNPSVSKLDSKTESCIVNCVERFIDTNQFIIKEFSNKLQDPSFGGPSSSGSSSLHGFDSNEPELVLDENKNFGSETNKETKKKSGWFW